MSFTLDPNAQSYTDDEIVGKVNTASATITRVGFTDMDKVSDGSTNKGYTATEQTKLSGIDEGAEANIGEEFSTAEQSKLTGIAENATVDQTGAEVRDLILALADTERGLVITDPTSGQFKVISVERLSDGKFNIQYDDVAES